jgi:hypothetical protein
MSSLIVSFATTALLIMFFNIKVGTAATVPKVTDNSDLF